MRTVIPLFASFSLLTALLAPRPVLAQSHHSLGLEAKVTATGGDSSAKSGLHWNPGGRPLGAGMVTATTKDYSQKRERDDGIGIDVEVRNLSREQDSAKLEWYFFAKRIDGKGDDYMFDTGSEKVTVEPNSTSKYDLQSASLHNSVVKKLHTTNAVNAVGSKIPPSASVQKSGSKLAGWIVRLVVDGAPMIVKASSPTYENLGKSDPQLAGYKRKP